MPSIWQEGHLRIRHCRSVGRNTARASGFSYARLEAQVALQSRVLQHAELFRPGAPRGPRARIENEGSISISARIVETDGADCCRVNHPRSSHVHVGSEAPR
jgi:hypothetical protein